MIKSSNIALPANHKEVQQNCATTIVGKISLEDLIKTEYRLIFLFNRYPNFFFRIGVVVFILIT